MSRLDGPATMGVRLGGRTEERAHPDLPAAPLQNRDFPRGRWYAPQEAPGWAQLYRSGPQPARTNGASLYTARAVIESPYGRRQRLVCDLPAWTVADATLGPTGRIHNEDRRSPKADQSQ
jgi:hypothetical protein